MVHLDYLKQYDTALKYSKKAIIDTLIADYQSIFPQRINAIKSISRLTVEAVIYHITDDTIIEDYKFEKRLIFVAKEQTLSMSELFDILVSVRHAIILHICQKNIDHIEAYTELIALFEEIISIVLTLSQNNNEEEQKQQATQPKKQQEEDSQTEIFTDKRKTDLIINKNKMAQIGEILDILYYQWNQPLTKINDIIFETTEKLDTKSVTTKDLSSMIVSISNETSNLMSAIDSFKTLFHHKDESSSTQLSDVIEQTINFIQLSLKRNGIDIITDFVFDSDIVTHEHELMLVLLNILKNAEESLSANNKDNPMIVIIGYQDQEYQYIEILDNGGGIKEENIDKIFDEFYTTKSKEGSGLGLYMSKVVIEDQLMGELRAENVDEGVRFVIALPLLYKK